METPKKCAKCGSVEFLPDGRCKPCRKAYMKAYRSVNAEKIKGQKQEYNSVNAEKVKVQNSIRGKKWRKDNPEKARQRSDEWAKNHPEKAAEIKARWLSKNRERHYKNTSAWAKRNRPSRRIHWHNYKARKLVAGGTFTPDDVSRIMKAQKGKCVVCRTDISNAYHADHIMPLFLGGSNEARNIQLLCPHCNTSKQAKHPIDFMQSRGFLL